MRDAIFKGTHQNIASSGFFIEDFFREVKASSTRDAIFKGTHQNIASSGFFIEDFRVSFVIQVENYTTKSIRDSFIKVTIINSPFLEEIKSQSLKLVHMKGSHINVSFVLQKNALAFQLIIHGFTLINTVH